MLFVTLQWHVHPESFHLRIWPIRRVAFSFKGIASTLCLQRISNATWLFSFTRSVDDTEVFERNSLVGFVWKSGDCWTLHLRLQVKRDRILTFAEKARSGQVSVEETLRIAERRYLMPKNSEPPCQVHTSRICQRMDSESFLSFAFRSCCELWRSPSKHKYRSNLLQTNVEASAPSQLSNCHGDNVQLCYQHECGLSFMKDDWLRMINTTSLQNTLICKQV